MEAAVDLFAFQPIPCPHLGFKIAHGRFFRKSDRKHIQRWRCLDCRKTFSEATDAPEFGQNKRHLNRPIEEDLCSGVSQRRISLLKKISRTTVARKLKFLGLQARFRQIRYLTKFVQTPVVEAQFDEMETHEHTKMKPLSIALMVEKGSRKILGFSVSSMPAKGLLAKKSVKKYGWRKDDRAQGMANLLNQVEHLLDLNATLTSDQNPKYPGWLEPTSYIHKTIKGQRGAITGQGELKKIAFDPIFSLNHTCAMIRANVNRLFRKTWCTTKKAEALVDHLWLYMDFHNQVLTKN